MSPRGIAGWALVAVLVLGVGQHARGRQEEPSFALLTTGQLVIGEGTRVRGGAVGSSGLSDRDRFSVVIRGARIAGDVYGPAVLLGRGTFVQNVYANALEASARARFRELFPFRAHLPDMPRSPNIDEDPDAIIVPRRAEVVLTPSATTVDVLTGGTLILTGGLYELEALRLERFARVEVRGPSRILLSRALEMGEWAGIGPARGKPALNLEIIVSGADINGVPAAHVAAHARLTAALAVPNGSLAMGDHVHLLGTFYARDASLGAHASLRHVPGWLFAPDEQCLMIECDFQATSGGTISSVCQEVPVPAGTPCDDGNACTDGDNCNRSGSCQPGPPLPQPAGENPCWSDTCDPVRGYYQPAGTACDATNECREPMMCNQTGLCTEAGPPLPAGTPCDDGIPNNGTDSCSGTGLCYGSLGAFDCLANNCSAGPGLAPDMECWLNSHPSIRQGIRWILASAQGSTPITYDQWEPWRKQDLQQAVEDAWTWYDSAMTNFPGIPFTDPPVNQRVLTDPQVPTTELGHTTQAWPIYIAHVAHSLMVEIRGLVPWSLCDYEDYMLEIFPLLQVHAFYWITNASTPDVELFTPVTPSHPTVTFPFLVNNNLIGPTRLATIGNMITWAHRMKHYAGPYTTENVEAHWQYRGVPPQIGVLNATIVDPNVYGGFPNPEHWTRGCWGTSGFLQQMLRAVNIPVKIAPASPTCGHATPYFTSEDRYLSHGDDPYTGFWKEGQSTLVPPGEEFLIDGATHAAWFDATPGCSNVGRRAVELMIDYPPDPLVVQYCNDVAQNLSHADGTVYEHFQSWYSVPELEAEGLWVNLDQRAQQLNLCGEP